MHIVTRPLVPLTPQARVGRPMTHPPARRAAVHARAEVSPGGLVPPMSPAPGGAIPLPPGTADLVGLVALGVVAGATATQLFAPAAVRHHARPAGAVAGALAGLLLPGAMGDLPTTGAVAAAAWACSRLALQPALAARLGPERAGNLAPLAACGLTLAGLASAQLLR